MARIDFPDGRWVELRPMYVDDELALDELAKAGDAVEAAGEDRDEAYRRYIDLLRQTKAVIEDATTAKSWEGSVGRMSRDDLMGLLGQWRRVTEDDAVPPVNGASS